MCLPVSLAWLWSSESRLTSSLPTSSEKTGLKRDFPGPFIKIEHEQYRIVGPVLANDQNGRVARRDHLEVAPTVLGTSLRMRMMMRSVQFSIELGSGRCLATLTCSYA